MKHLRLRWYNVLIVGLILVGFAGWMGWQAVRPPSPRYWSAMLDRAQAAESRNQFRLATRCMQKALAEAKRFSPADVRLAETWTRQGDLWLAARLYGKSPIATPGRTPTGIVDNVSAQAEQKLAKRITPAQIDDAYRQALSIYENAYAADRPKLLGIYTDFIRRFQQTGNKKQRLSMAGKVFTLQAQLVGSDSAKLLPILDRLIDLLAGDSKAMLPYQIKRYAIIRKAYAGTDRRAADAYFAAYTCAVSVREYDQAAKLAKDRITDFADTDRYDRRRLVPQAEYARALARAGRLSEAEAAFQQGIVLCDRAFPKRFFDYPKYSMFDLPIEMYRFYYQYYYYLVQTNQSDLAERVVTILAD